MSKSMKSIHQDSKLQNSINKTTIDSIKKSNAAMRDELNAEIRLSSLTNAQTGSKIAKLQEKGTFYAKQIEIEAKKLHDLERQVEMMQESISQKRVKLQKVEGNSSDSLGKQIKQLERRLDKTLQKQNEILADNRQLKEEIDHLRRERVTFDKIYKKLEVELQEKKKTLLEVFESSKKAKARKQTIEDQIKNLQLRVKREESNLEREFQDVFKDINERTMEEKDEKFASFKERTDNARKSDIDSPVNKTNRLLEETEEDEQSRASVKKGQKSIEKRQRDSTGKTPQEEVEEYNTIFESLKKKTHRNDIKEIIKLFEDYENKNYSLYKHLGDLGDEKETLEKQIQQIKEDIAQLSQSQQKDISDDTSDIKAQKFQELKDEIEEADRHYKFLEAKQSGLADTINALKVSIPIIFERIGCKAEDYINELLDGTTVNEGNMFQYLAIIEKKTNEILQMYNYSQNKAAGSQIKPEGEYKRANEESVVLGNANFPERELLQDLQLAPEKAEMQTAKDFQDYASEKIQHLLGKKNSKATKA